MNIKKVLSVLLAAMMIFSLFIPASAAAEVQDCPVIYIPGINTSPIYTDKNDPSTLITVPDNQQLIDFVKKDLLPAAITYAADKNAEKLSKAVCGPINEMFAGWFNNPDGSAKGNSGAVVTIPEKISKKDTIRFDYDWRGDPVEIAAELDAFVEAVCLKSGCEQVAVIVHSLGSVITGAYISEYGNGRIKSIVLDSPAIEGVSYIGEMLSGRMNIDSAAFMNYLRGVLTTAEYDELVHSSLDILEIAGMTDYFIELLDDALDVLAPVLIKDTLVPIFGSWLTIWAMVPDEDLDESMNFVFNEIYKGEDMSALVSKIEAYSSLVRENREKLLLDLDKNAKLAVISRYGFSSIPLTDEWKILSDTVIDTASTSLGAVTADYNSTFSEEYLADKAAEYISPDRTVDASGCLFPEKTWFIKNTTHAETWVTRNLSNMFLFAEEELTCDSSELSRFSYYDRENDTVVEDTTSPAKDENTSALAKFFNFLRIILEKIADFFKGIFKA